MSFHLTVAFGLEAGKTYEIKDGERCVIGRAESAQLQIADEAVSWEHAAFVCEGDRLYVENLSALGTKVNGQKIAGRTRVNPDDRVELAANAVIDVQGDDPAGAGATTLTVALVIFIIVLGGLGLAGTIVYRSFFDRPVATGPTITDANWDQAFLRIDRRLTQWVESGQFPAEQHELLRAAWRAERLRQMRQANTDYKSLAAAFMIHPAPGFDGQPFTQAASHSMNPLGVLMGAIEGENPDAEKWRGDDTYVSALVWFVRERIKRTTADATGAGGPGLGL